MPANIATMGETSKIHARQKKKKKKEENQGLVSGMMLEVPPGAKSSPVLGLVQYLGWLMRVPLRDI